jgi:hypothetical protein
MSGSCSPREARGRPALIPRPTLEGVGGPSSPVAGTSWTPRRPQGVGSTWCGEAIGGLSGIRVGVSGEHPADSRVGCLHTAEAQTRATRGAGTGGEVPSAARAALYPSGGKGLASESAAMPTRRGSAKRHVIRWWRVRLDGLARDHGSRTGAENDMLRNRNLEIEPQGGLRLVLSDAPAPSS